MVQSFSPRVPSQEHVACIDQAFETVASTLHCSGLWLRWQKQLIPVMQHLEEWDIPQEADGVFSVPQYVSHRDGTLVAAVPSDSGERYVDESFASFTPSQFIQAQAVYMNSGFARMEGQIGLQSAAQTMRAEGTSRWRVDSYVGDTALTSLAIGAPEYPRANSFARFNMRPLITVQHEVTEAGCHPIGPGSMVSALVQYDMAVQSPAMFLAKQSEAAKVPEQRRAQGITIGALVASELAERTGQQPTPGDQQLIALYQKRLQAAQQGNIA